MQFVYQPVVRVASECHRNIGWPSSQTPFSMHDLVNVRHCKRTQNATDHREADKFRCGNGLDSSCRIEDRNQPQADKPDGNHVTDRRNIGLRHTHPDMLTKQRIEDKNCSYQGGDVHPWVITLKRNNR